MFSRTKIRPYTKNSSGEMKNGYLEMINRGVAAVRNFQNEASFGYGTREARIQSLKEEIRDADSIVIGAGAGLSTSAGFVYNGERFRRWFSDFADKYGFQDMYSGGFYPYKTREEFWAYWARYIYINRYLDAPIPVYEKLLKLVQEKEYFIITTNVDHCFQKAGFDKRRLFYTQGDYGLFQSSRPSSPVTYDNEEWVMQAMEAQGYLREKEGIFKVPEGKNISMSIPTELIPICPDDGLEMTMNLRSDDTFVEDEGWHRASAAYADFLDRNNDCHVLYLELGVGQNTPVIIKYPFWERTFSNHKAVYACINYGEAFCPGEIWDRSICIDDDINEVVKNVIGVPG